MMRLIQSIDFPDFRENGISPPFKLTSLRAKLHNMNDSGKLLEWVAEKNLERLREDAETKTGILCSIPLSPCRQTC